MKKNKMMRMAAVLMVAVLATTCALSGSFAKYVGEDEASDSARVAAFGVKVNVQGEAAIFSEIYAVEDSTVPESAGIENSVVASASYKLQAMDGNDVVAPGTSGSIVAESLSGTPEVAVAVSASGVSVDVGSGWTVYPVGEDGEPDDSQQAIFYCPIQISCGNDTECGLNYTSAELFAAAVKDMIVKDMTTYIPAGTDATTVNTGNANLSWAWAFDEDSDNYPQDTTLEQSDFYDTQLGDAATTSNAETISITMDITVTQVD